MTPYEAVYGQKANYGILVGANAVSEFIDEDQTKLNICMKMIHRLTL